MKYSFRITINDYKRAGQTKYDVQIGHYFIFVKRKGLFKRLLAKLYDKNNVLPLVDKPVHVEGLTITPKHRSIDPIGCVVTERDLYRAEQDTVHLFIAFITPPKDKDLRLAIDCNGELFIERPVELTDGVGIETLSMLLPGHYQAQLSTAGRRLGTPVSFTVAEYTLAPLSARLLSHKLKRDTETFSFELAVESYQMPFEGELTVALVEQSREIAQIKILPLSPGRYAGDINMRGEGPFRLRLMASNDAERVAEVAIPGSRAVERQISVISKLGKERHFSMMPEANALPLRGGYLTSGDFIASPLTVEEIVTLRRVIHVNADVKSLVLVNLDLTSGKYSVQNVGNVSAGKRITVMTDSPFCTVFVGGFVNGQPFEGYTTFIKPSQFQLSVETPKTIRPREELVVSLSCEAMEERTIPVLLCVRDERLTATDKPEVSLGAAAKRGIDMATVGMDERTFTTYDEWLDHRYNYKYGMGGMDQTRFDPGTLSALTLDLEEETDSRIAQEKSPQKEEMIEPPRADFPEVLFYDIISVTGTQDVVIPLGDSLGTFTIETFAMSEGDWTQNQTTVEVDQPVRIDLELPPAVHPDDKVIGRLRAITSTRKARITLTLNGKTVALRNGNPIEALSTETPIELEFYVNSGTYFATVEDSSTGENDSIEVVVGEPGKFKSHAKELGLLVKDESINLKTADALSLRLLPNIDTSFETLITATAGYAHLCCEQTAAKILAATFMYITAKNEGEGQRSTAEQIILAGIAREQKMIRPGQGFTMYPESSHISDYYSKLAVRYLWKLNQLDELPDISRPLRQSVREGLKMADQAAKAHQMQRFPEQITSIEDAYTLAAAGKNISTVGQFIENVVDFSGPEASLSLKNRQHAVSDRATLAYAAAGLIAMGDLRNGIKLANQVTRQFNEQGRLYSTVDSVAALALMIQLRISGIVTDKACLRVNGQEMTASDAAQLNDRVESIEVLDGVAAVEVTRVHEEDWGAFAYHFPVKIGFRNARDMTVQHFGSGDRVELVVSLPDGYQTGDLVHVALPACLSWIQGGGKVKQFTLDFEGQDELRIPLVVTSKIEDQQHFAVCVRNMFEEERATSPGMLTIEDRPQITTRHDKPVLWIKYKQG